MLSNIFVALTPLRCRCPHVDVAATGSALINGRLMSQNSGESNLMESLSWSVNVRVFFLSFSHGCLLCKCSSQHHSEHFARDMKRVWALISQAVLVVILHHNLKWMDIFSVTCNAIYPLYWSVSFRNCDLVTQDQTSCWEQFSYRNYTFSLYHYT